MIATIQYKNNNGEIVDDVQSWDFGRNLATFRTRLKMISVDVTEIKRIDWTFTAEELVKIEEQRKLLEATYFPPSAPVTVQ
mgnify:FL=1